MTEDLHNKKVCDYMVNQKDFYVILKHILNNSIHIDKQVYKFMVYTYASLVLLITFLSRLCNLCIVL